MPGLVANTQVNNITYVNRYKVLTTLVLCQDFCYLHMLCSTILHSICLVWLRNQTSLCPYAPAGQITARIFARAADK